MDTTFDPTGGKGMTYQAAVPTSMAYPGKKGQTANDGTYWYLCIADNTWRRITLETF